jgi:uncharacterized phage-like protein YoqJ
MLKISFTGHRPDKLGGYDWNSEKNIKIRKKLYETILDIMNKSDEKQFHFISGGALGVDQFAFSVVNHIIKESNLDSICFTNEIAVPFKNQAIKWFNQEDVQRYNKQLSEADKVTYVDRLDEYKIKGYKEDVYYPAKMQKRNEYMVDSSDIVIAVWDGTKGGTHNCVKYAEKQDKKIIIINPKEI